MKYIKKYWLIQGISQKNQRPSDRHFTLSVGFQFWFTSLEFSTAHKFSFFLQKRVSSAVIMARSLSPLMIDVDVDSDEVSFRASRGTPQDRSINSHVSRVVSHLMSPVMGRMGVGTVYPIRGLKWHNPDYKNSCNIDSFLTFLKLLALKHPKLMIYNLRLKEDVTESCIRDIINGYVTARNDPVYEAQDRLARISWIQNVMRIPPRRGVKIDVAGDQNTNIFSHLLKSMEFYWIYQCGCGSTGRQFDLRTSLFVNCAAEFTDMFNTYEPVIGPRYKKVCKRCRSPSWFRGFQVPKTTWLLRCIVQNPKYDCINTPNFLTMGATTFKLAYVTYTNEVNSTLGHQTSMHLIKDQWFHFDGLNYGGELRKVNDPELAAQYTPTEIVYFKWYDHN